MNTSEEDHTTKTEKDELKSKGDSMHSDETNRIRGIEKLTSQVQENKTNILLITSMLENQGEKIDKIYDALVGNGRRDSVYARLLVTEHNQEEAMKERKLFGKQIDKLTDSLYRVEQRSQEDRRSVISLEAGQKRMSAGLAENTDTIQSWRNRAIGIGIGVGIGTSIILFLLQQLIANAATP